MVKNLFLSKNAFHIIRWIIRQIIHVVYGCASDKPRSSATDYDCSSCKKRALRANTALKEKGKNDVCASAHEQIEFYVSLKLFNRYV